MWVDLGLGSACPIVQPRVPGFVQGFEADRSSRSRPSGMDSSNRTQREEGCGLRLVGGGEGGLGAGWYSDCL